MESRVEGHVGFVLANVRQAVRVLRVGGHVAARARRTSIAGFRTRRRRPSRRCGSSLRVTRSYAWAGEIPRSRAASSTVAVTRFGLTLTASGRRL